MNIFSNMYRVLIRYVNVFINQSKLNTQTNHLTRKISLSSCCIKQNHSSSNTDDLNDVTVPNYVEIEHRKFSKARFIGFLTEKLLCQAKRADQICTDFPNFSKKTLNEVSRNVDLLVLKGVTNTLILDNPLMLTLSRVHLSSNICMLDEMKPKNINDVAPLATLPATTLNKIKEIAIKEANIIPGNHRIYYLSKLLNLNASTVSQYLSGLSFVLTMPFNKLDNRIKDLLKFITPENVVNHLKLLKLPESEFKSRLARLVNGISSNEENEEKILNGRSRAQYYSDRLNLDLQMVEDLIQHYPKLRTAKIVLIKDKLNYFLNEANFSASDIVRSPHILFQSLKKNKARIQELQSYGCTVEFILAKVIQNSKRYKKVVDKLEMSTKSKKI